MQADTLVLAQMKDSQIDQTNQATKDKFERAIILMDPYVHPQKDGTFTVDSAALQLDIEPDVFTHLKSSLDHGNALTRLGRTQPQSAAISFIAGPGSGGPGGGPGGSPTPPPPQPPRKTCAGQDVLLTFWWGTKVYVDECLTLDIEKLLAVGVATAATGAAIATLLGGIPGIPFAVIGGILGLDNAYITFIDTVGLNNGVIFNQPWIGPGWVWHQ
jgi:hypothetical protein